MSDGAYEIVGGELRPVAPPPEAPAPPRPALGSLPLQLSLVGALLAYFIDSGDWFRRLERRAELRQRRSMLEPYRRWALQHPQTCDDVRAAPDAFRGKSVIWTVARGAGGAYFCDADPAKPLVWTDGVSLIAELADPAVPFRTLARIEGGGETGPQAALLEITAR